MVEESQNSDCRGVRVGQGLAEGTIWTDRNGELKTGSGLQECDVCQILPYNLCILWGKRFRAYGLKKTHKS